MTIQVISSANPHLSPFRALCLGEKARHVPTPPLTRIAGFGADYSSQTGLSYRDHAWFGHTLGELNGFGIGVSSEFQFLPVNRTDGNDFYDPKLNLSADILIACFVNHPNALMLDKSLQPIIGAAAQKLKNEYPHLFETSPHFTDTACGETAIRSGARIIVTFSQAGEICASDFENKNYVRGPRSIVTAQRASKVPAHPYVMECLFRRDMLSGFAKNLGWILTQKARAF